MCSNCAGDYENPDATAVDETLAELGANLRRIDFNFMVYCVVREALGEGNTLDLLLRDEYNRRKLNLHARAL